jgi:hypothetical protein
LFSVTDVSSGWTDFTPLVVREQSLVTKGLDAIFSNLPFSVSGINSDNDSAFVNDTLVKFCDDRNINFTRSRPYHKNDQAWIEQKNGSVIRRMAGYGRFTGIAAGQALAHLYRAVQPYINYFQPSFKLRSKSRNGSKINRTYYPPATPCDRLLRNPIIDQTVKEKLLLERKELDPIELLHRIRESQSALAALASNRLPSDGLFQSGIDQFMSQLPQLWQNGEVRATHRKRPDKPHYWRTREDTFKDVWYKVLCWPEETPDATAKSLFERLQNESPGKYKESQLRTLQRRVRGWRTIMAKKLIYSCIEGQEKIVTTVKHPRGGA